MIWPGSTGGNFPGGAYRALEARGAASPIGVRGVFMRMFGGGVTAHLDAVGFVYADLAHAQGYLTPLRELAVEEYSGLIRDARRWAADADRVTADLIGEFGEPSLWRPRYNPRYPTTSPTFHAAPSTPSSFSTSGRRRIRRARHHAAAGPGPSCATSAGRGPVRGRIHLHPDRPALRAQGTPADGDRYRPVDGHGRSTRYRRAVHAARGDAADRHRGRRPAPPPPR